jgi:hypothetical protein
MSLSFAVSGMSTSRKFGLVFRVALKTKMSVERWWNDADGATNEVLGEKPVPFSLYRPKILHVFTRACPDTSRWRWMWSVGGLILTGEIWSAGSKNCPNMTFITTNFISTGPGSKPGLCSCTPELRHGLLFPKFITIMYTNWVYAWQKTQSVFITNTSRCVRK